MSARYSLYAEIAPWITTISKLVLDADESNVWEEEWRTLKDDIRALAEKCEGRIQERRDTDRRALAKSNGSHTTE